MTETSQSIAQTLDILHPRARFSTKIRLSQILTKQVCIGVKWLWYVGAG